MPSSPYRLIFMGTPAFAVPSLEGLLSADEKVVAVVTQPDRPKGRGRKLTPPPVKELALRAGLPVLQPLKIRTPEFLEEIRAFQPDLLVVAAYGRILPGPLLDLPPLGTINVHGSLLPKYRGAAPIQWAVLNGEPETGITIMQMDEGMDTGDILLQSKLSIEPHDTAGTLSVKMAALGGRLLREALDRLHAGTLPRQPQNEAGATLAPPLSKEAGRIDWSRTAVELGNLIRGLDPWPSAYTFLEGKRLRLFRPQVVEAVNEAPGTVVRAEPRGLLIAAGDGGLLVQEVQLEGSRRLPVEEFLRGRPLPAGLRFE